jgi:hypothetical protein
MFKRKISLFRRYLKNTITNGVRIRHTVRSFIVTSPSFVFISRYSGLIIKQVSAFFAIFFSNLYTLLLKFPPTRFVINKFIRPVILRIKNRFEKIDSKYQITNIRVWNRQRKVGFGLSLIILVSLLTYAGIRLWGPGTAAAWWDDEWGYRVEVTLNNSGSELTDFQVGFTLDTASLISSGKMQADCDDIRVVDNAQTTIIPHWLEACNLATTKIWVKLSTIPTGTQALYVYYGNSGVPGGYQAVSSDIFEYVDEFPGSSIDETKWTITDATGWSVTGGELKGTNTTGRLTSVPTFTNPTVLEIKYRYITVSTNGFMSGGFFNSTTDSFGHLHLPTYDYYRSNSSWVMLNLEGPSATDLRLTITSKSATQVDLSLSNYSTGSSYQSASNVNNAISNEPITLGKRYDNSYPGENYEAYWDFIFIRKYSANLSVNASKEVAGRGPVAYWKFDEGYATETLNPLTKNEQQINLINESITLTSTGYYPDDNSLGVVHWDADKYSDATVYFEATMRHGTNCGACDVNAALYNSSGTQVTGSELLVAYTNWERVRSGALNLPTGDYHIRVKNYGYTAYIWSARLIIIQSDSSDKITATETQVDIGDNEGTASGTYNELTNKKIYSFDSSKYSPAPDTYFEASFKPYSPKVEQQINIIDRVYSWSNGSYNPTDHSLGIIHWDDDKFSGSYSVYFEAVMQNSDNCGACDVFASLYTATDTPTQVTGSEIIKNDSGYARVRSSALSLTDDTDYTVRVKNENYTGTIKAARLIIVQSDSTKLTDTQTQIEVGSYQTGFANTSYTELTDPKYYLYDQNKFSPAPETSGDIEFHASLNIADAGDSVYAELYNKTNNTTVAELSHTGDTKWTLKSTSNVDGDADWDTTNDDEYVVRVRCNDDNGGGCSGSISNAKIAINQSDANGITALETIQQHINSPVTTTSTSYADNERLNWFQHSNFGTYPDVYFESTMKVASGGTAVASGINDSTRTILGEVTATETSYTRKRSSSSFTNSINNLPYNYDTQIKTQTGSYQASIANSWFIIQLSGIPTNGIIGGVELYDSTGSSSVTNSQLTSSDAGFNIVRSPEITLTSGNEFVARLKQAYLLNARIIHSQSNSNGIYAVETYMPLITTAMTETSSSYVDKEVLDYYDPENNQVIENYNLGKIYYEATLKTSAGTGYTILKNDTDGLDVNGSELSTTGSSYDLVRSTNSIGLDMPVSAKTMDARIKNVTGGTTTVSSSWIVIQNNNSFPATIHDSTVNNHTGNLSGASWQEESNCKAGKCLSFDGSNDYVLVNDSSKLDASASDSLSVSLWFKLPEKTTGTGTLIAKYESTYTDGGYKLYMDDDGDVIAAIDDDNTSFPEDFATSTTANFDDNHWHHVVMVRESNTSLNLYIDGDLIDNDSSINAAGSIANNDYFYIGIDGDGESNPFSGLIDEVKIYPYARDATQIKLDYIRGSGVLGESTMNLTSQGLVAYYKMDEATADTCDGTNDSCDSSGYGNHAAWNDNASTTAGKFSNALGLDGTSDRSVLSNDLGIPSKTTWYDDTWQNRLLITFDNSDSTEDLNNFPVLIKLNSSRINYSMVRDAGEDIRFTDSDGVTLLPHEIEKWDESGDSFIWVKVPNIPSDSNNDNIYLYYNNPSASDSQDKNSVWDSDFKLVNHLNENCGASNCILDSTTPAENGTPYQSGTPANIYTESGKFAGAQSFNGSNRYVGVPTISIADSITVEAWIYSTNFAQNGFIVEKDPVNSQWELFFEGANFIWRGGNTLYQVSTPTSGISNSNWHYVAATQTGTNVVLYVDGVQKNTGSSTTPINNGTDIISIGRHSSGYYFNGTIDEVRLSNSVRSGEWIEAQYKSLTDTFNSYGIEEDPFEKVPFSVSAWVNGNTLDTTSRAVIARGNSGNYSWAIYNDGANPGKLAFTADNSANIGVSTTTLSANAWYHVVIVSDGAKTRLYINGSLDKETNNSSLLSGGSVSIGADPDGTNAWAGKIDEVRIYNRALDATEAANLYNLSTGPIVYYDFNSSSGNILYDKSGNGRNSTLYGMSDSSWVSGYQGSALYFNGVDDYVDLGTDSWLDIAGGDFTISLWARWTEATGNARALLNLGGFTNKISITTGANAAGQDNIGFGVTACGWLYDAGSGLNNDQWQHITVRKSGSNCKIFINGLPATNLTGGMTWNSNNRIGDGYHGDFKGNIDEIRIYNYARSDEDILGDSEGNPAINQVRVSTNEYSSNLVGYWNFNEDVGDVVYDSSSSEINGNLDGNCPGASTCPTRTLAGKYGRAIYFDGGDKIDFGDNYDTTFTGSYTVTTWIKTTSATSNIRLMGKGLNLFDINFNYSSLGRLAYAIGQSDPDALYSTATNLNNGLWRHLAFVHDGTTQKIYVDGRLDSQRTEAVAPVVNNSIFSIGYDNSGYGTRFVGTIDDVKIYNIALPELAIRNEATVRGGMTMGAVSTESDGFTPTHSAARGYCPPGDITASCAPVAEYKLDEKTGTSANDTSGNSYTATFSSSSFNWLHSGKCVHGTCLESIDNNSANTTNVVSTQTTNISMETWFYWNGQNQGNVIIYNGASGSNGYGLLLSNGSCGIGNEINVLVGGKTCDAVNSTYTPPANTWIHLALTRDASTWRLYVNGEQKHTGTTNPNAPGTNTKFGEFQGRIDEVRFYNYTRNPAQIAWSYNRGAPVAHWKFDECTGNTIYDSAQKADDSGTRYDGTIYPQSQDNTATGSCNSGVATEMWNDGTSGKRNASLGFDGDDDYALVPHNTNLDIAGSNWTISLWAKFTSTSGDQMLVDKGYWNSCGYYVNWYGGRLYMSSYSGGLQQAYTDINQISAGQWYHLTFVRNGTEGKIYINGKETDVVSGSFNNATACTDRGVKIGLDSQSLNHPFNGQMDDVKLFNFALTTKQIITEYNGGAIKFGP